MEKNVFISICIPAFKRVEFLKRLLDAVATQTFRDFEVIVTDDSPDDAVKALCVGFGDQFVIHYFRNPSPLGTPENWNEAIRKARGEWIKLMHDDDWLADADSLQKFVDAIKSNPGTSFFFSAYRNIYLQESRQEEVHIAGSRYKWLTRQAATLFSRNVVGPPSVVIHRNDQQLFYDKRVKWVVDIDFYIRYFAKEKPVYIDKVLVNVGIGEHQVTQDCFRRRKVEIPENFYLLNKLDIGVLKNILVYDAWWRLMRNLEVTLEEQIREAGYEGPIHPVILSMVRWQRQLPKPVLTTGISSKIIMFVHYLTHRNRIR